VIIDVLNTLIEVVIREPLTQITWFLWMIVILAAYFYKDDRKVKKLMLISAVFWWAHFYLLWVYAWVASIFIWVIRIIWSLKYKQDQRAFVGIFVITIILWYITYEWIVSLLPILASITWAYSYFYLEKVKLRLVMVFNSWMYLTYNFFVWSISWVINEVLVQVILIFTIYRMVHPEWGSKYYFKRIWGIIKRKRERPDYDRFVFVYDKISEFKQKSWIHLTNILEFDTRRLIPQKHFHLFHKHKDTLREKLIKKLNFKKLIPQK